MINCNGTLLLVNHRLTDAQLNTVAALTVQRCTCSQIAAALQCARADVVSAQRAIANAIPARTLTADDVDHVRTLTLERLSSVTQAILLTMNLREVKRVRAELGLSGRVRLHQWTADEDRYLIANYCASRRRAVAEALGVSQNQVTIRAKQLGLVGTKDEPVRRTRWAATYEERCKAIGKWTDKQIEYVRGHAERVGIRQLVDKVCEIGPRHSVVSVRSMARHFGLTTINQREWGRPYTEQERRFMLDNWQRLGIHELAAAMADDVTPKRVKTFLQQNGVSGGLAHTLPEYVAMAMLRAHKVPYKAFARVRRGRFSKGWEVDILVDKLAIEVQGDFWHGNPRKFKTLNDLQRRRRRDDERKRAELVASGYRYMALWEDDLLHRPAEVEQALCVALVDMGIPGERLDQTLYANSAELCDAAVQEFANGAQLRALLHHGEDEQLLTAHADGKSLIDLAEQFKTTVADVRRRLAAHGAGKAYTTPVISQTSSRTPEQQLIAIGWTSAQVDHVKAHAATATPAELADRVDRPLAEVQALLGYMGVTSCNAPHERGRMLTERELAALAEWQHVDPCVLAHTLSVPVDTMVEILRRHSGVDPRRVGLSGPRRALMALLTAHRVEFTWSKPLVYDHAGRRTWCFVDCVVGDKVVLEIHGKRHGSGSRKQLAYDERRHAGLVAAGYVHVVIKEERLLFTPADVEADVCRVLAANGVPVVDADEPVYTHRGIAVDGVDVRRRYVVTDEGHVVPADADNETVAYSAAGEWPRDVLALARDMVGARRKPASIMAKLRTTFVQFVQLMTCVGTPYAPHGGVLTDVDEVDELLASVAAGLTNEQMATKFGTTRKRVAARLEELGARNPTRS